MSCPACGSPLTGLIGYGQFFCRECCVEFHLAKGMVSIYRPDPEGTLELLSRVAVPKEVEG